MRVVIAGIEYEGNSLSLRVDRREDFERKCFYEGAALLPFLKGKGVPLAGAVDVLQDAGVDIVPILETKGGSGGYVEDAFFEDVLNRIVEGVRAAMPIDGVFLSFHGAMICGREKDPEGTVLHAVRDVVGPTVPISTSLDLHAHVTKRMVSAADIIVGCETYPHVDTYETGIRAANLLVGAMRGEIRPVTRIRKYNAILPVLGGATLDDAPMAKVAAHARDLEKQKRALSISYFPVQPWLDMADVGITGLAVTDNDPQAAEAVAGEILDDMWNRRHDFELPALTADEAVPAALELDAKTVLLVDAPDSIGGGSCGDSPDLLAAILKHAPDIPSALSIYDPYAAARAFELGIGGEAEFDVGAWLDKRWFKPIRVKARVESLHDGRFVYKGGPANAVEASLGPTAVLSTGGLRLLVASHAVYEHMDEHYAACGIDIRECRLVSFKNLMNYRKLLTSEVTFLAIHGPGSTPLRLQNVDWKNRKRPYWPADDLESPLPLD
jgi:microcystin degradation protein MlrC